MFDLVKLSAMNADYLRALPDDEIVARLRAWRLSDERVRALVPLVRERMQRLDEFLPLVDFFFSGDLDYAPVAKDLLPRERTPKQVADLLVLFSEALDAQRDLSPAGLEAFARAFAEKNGWSSKELFMLLRLAATAKKATPPLFETLAGLGRELIRRRICLCADLVKKMPAPAPVKASGPPRRRRQFRERARLRRRAGRGLRPLPVLRCALPVL